MSNRQQRIFIWTGKTSYLATWIIVFLIGIFLSVEGFAKENQAIAIQKITTQKYGAKPLSVKAASTSKLPVSIFVNGPAVIRGGVLTIKGAGTVRIFALQAGDEQFKAAAPAMTSFLVEKAELTVKAEDKTMDEGGKEPELTLVYKGFVNGDTEKTLESTAKAKRIVRDRDASQQAPCSNTYVASHYCSCLRFCCYQFNRLLHGGKVGATKLH